MIRVGKKTLGWGNKLGPCVEKVILTTSFSPLFHQQIFHLLLKSWHILLKGPQLSPEPQEEGLEVTRQDSTAKNQRSWGHHEQADMQQKLSATLKSWDHLRALHQQLVQPSLQHPVSEQHVSEVPGNTLYFLPSIQTGSLVSGKSSYSNLRVS